jgi:hypothetical protein
MALSLPGGASLAQIICPCRRRKFVEPAATMQDSGQALKVNVKGASHWGALLLYNPRSEDTRRGPRDTRKPNGIFVTPVGMSRGDDLVSKWDKSCV